ncbi:hypothetical protein BFJ63_vAg19096 [Fusarium oxysporum f. sp. narcissi]|uniref:Ecp2 effector protein domain-containing protein n=1 Tax=Fusarium oxysporum f. sp. narcissi TaxID=451672 RepID=A0A4Q2UWN2_FUSOX|nr:hypothetical protein BFJ63_vAg19096 [Fusarium oxysporum f. sp. narcissi]
MRVKTCILLTAFPSNALAMSLYLYSGTDCTVFADELNGVGDCDQVAGNWASARFGATSQGYRAILYADNDCDPRWEIAEFRHGVCYSEHMDIAGSILIIENDGGQGDL